VNEGGTDRPLRAAMLADSLGDGGGIDRYAIELVRGLSVRPDIELTVVTGRNQVEFAESIASSLAEVIPIRGVGQIGRALWEREALGGLLARRGIQVVHGTKHVLPRTRLPAVLTAHDVTVLTSPRQFPLAKRLLVPHEYRVSLRRANVIVAVSETTRDRLVALDPSLAPRVVVIPNGASSALTRVSPKPVRGLEQRVFALAVGDLSPRKNLDLLLGLWDEIHARTGMLLVVVGPDGWRSSATRRRAQELVARGIAARPGRISDAELRWCYEHAAVVLYPSFEEGFGLPVLEALALGAPVIASTDAALVEVGRGHPTHVDPRDASGWRRAIFQVAASRHRPGRMVVSDWSDAVDGTAHAYRAALRGVDAERR